MRLFLLAFLIGNSLAPLSHAEPRAFKNACVVAQARGATFKPLKDPIQQWQKWEVTSNIAKYQEPSQAFPLQFTLVAADPQKVTVEVSERTPQALKDVFFRNGQIAWPKHPYNTEDAVPYHTLPADGALSAQFTASRSIAFKDVAGNPFTVKLPTNFPHKTERQTSKAFLKDDLTNSRVRAEWVQQQNAKLGLDPNLTILEELIVVIDKATENGFIVRDLRPLQDGNYYLPAFSIPFQGRDIAARSSVDFHQFWRKNYAEKLGEMKARMLVRYGVQMVTPNPQNMLIQLDKNMKPTGKMIFRDVTDSNFVEWYAKSAGMDSALQKDRDIHWDDFDSDLNPYASNSMWRLDEVGDASIPSDVLAGWEKAHDRKYAETILELLGIQKSIPAEGNPLAFVQEVLKSAEGKAAIRKFHQLPQQ